MNETFQRGKHPRKLQMRSECQQTDDGNILMCKIF